MKTRILFLLLVLASIAAFKVNAADRYGKKPQWVTKGENSLNAKRSNNSYYFKGFMMSGADLHALRNNNVNQLSTYIGSENKISGQGQTDILNVSGQDTMSKETIRISFNQELTAKVFYARLVDEYWEYKNGVYEYYVLFAVSEDGKEPQFDEFSSSTSYGAAPVAMSIIPGLGQMYKGSYLKGGLMMAGTAAGVVSIILCENQRADYHNKMLEQPRFAQDYNTKANNWETARNISIGVTAAIYLYNLIDAAAAKGARRVIVKRSNARSLSLLPMATPQGAGISLAYNF